MLSLMRKLRHKGEAAFLCQNKCGCEGFWGTGVFKGVCSAALAVQLLSLVGPVGVGRWSKSQSPVLRIAEVGKDP